MTTFFFGSSFKTASSHNGLTITAGCTEAGFIFITTVLHTLLAYPISKSATDGSDLDKEFSPPPLKNLHRIVAYPVFTYFHIDGLQ